MEGLVWLGIVIVFSIVKAAVAKSEKTKGGNGGGVIPPSLAPHDTSFEEIYDEKPSMLEQLANLLDETEEPEVKLTIPSREKKVSPKPLPSAQRVIPRHRPALVVEEEPIVSEVQRGVLQEAFIWKEILDKPLSLR